MAKSEKKPVSMIKKPFLTGKPTDERTIPGAAGFLGALLLAVLLTFLVCTMLGAGGAALRIVLNLAMEAAVLFFFYNSAISKGTEAVARGEILYQKQEKGSPFAESERAMCYHPMKGYLTALLGTLPFFIVALLLAVMAHRQTTGAGTLPSWLNSYLGRSDVGDALVSYTATEAMTLEDVLRIIVRIIIMPFVSMIGTENKDALLTVERLSPMLVLLPAVAYGTGYLRGPGERTKIHTGIAESDKRRVKKEKKARKARMAPKPKGPQQLN